jgi:hypothetical protein
MLLTNQVVIAFKDENSSEGGCSTFLQKDAKFITSNSTSDPRLRWYV